MREAVPHFTTDNKNNESENSIMKKNLTSNFMGQVNNNKNSTCSATYLNNTNNMNISKDKNYNSNINNDNASISITNSLLNNDQNMSMRPQMGMNKNCGGGLHNSYQKSLLSSYNMNNMSMNHLMNNSMN
ncbi:hypothetical protein PFBG_03009, partial [Plasmodium falciparum 7G8]